MNSPFHHSTPEQLRAFRLLTIAQLVYLETMGLGIGTPPSAKKAAITALGLNESHGANRMTPNEIIAALRKAATESIGHDPKHTDAPTKPHLPADFDAPC